MDWIFQSNPDTYDVVAATQRSVRDWWRMSQHRSEVTPGDRVFFWRAGKSAGVVAVGKVTSPVYEQADESGSGRYAVDVEYEIPRYVSGQPDTSATETASERTPQAPECLPRTVFSPPRSYNRRN